VRTVLANLAEDLARRSQRATVILRVVVEMSEAQVATALGIPPGTVKSNLARGLRKVRDTIVSTRTPERTL
jgi:DNA-directed RNA polymerase specialized sigma24 family protein